MHCFTFNKYSLMHRNIASICRYNNGTIWVYIKHIFKKTPVSYFWHPRSLLSLHGTCRKSPTLALPLTYQTSCSYASCISISCVFSLFVTCHFFLRRCQIFRNSCTTGGDEKKYINGLIAQLIKKDRLTTKSKE